jgi:hypothetical protein
MVTKDELKKFMQSHRLAVIATAGRDRKPEAALVDIAVTDALEVIFETTSATRKINNLRENPQVSLVIGWNDNKTLQCDGLVDQPLGREQERVIQQYLTTYPEKASHQHWPGNHHFRVRSLWMRFSDYHSPRSVVEFQFPYEPEPGSATQRLSFGNLIKRLARHATSR